MSDSMLVFIRGNKIPSIDDLCSALKTDGLVLESWDKKSLLDIAGFWPASYNGEDTGFEFSIGEIEEEDLEDWGIDEDQLDDRDLVVELGFMDEMDITASALCAAYLCKVCDGITFDDDDALSINAENCEQWLSDYI